MKVALASEGLKVPILIAFLRWGGGGGGGGGGVIQLLIMKMVSYFGSSK